MKLDDKQKKIMKTFCLYLGSYGTKEGYLGFHFYNDRPEMSWEGWTSPVVRVKIEGFDAINNLAEDIKSYYPNKSIKLLSSAILIKP